MKKSLVLLMLPAVALAVYDSHLLSANNWQLLFHNDGRVAYDPSLGGSQQGWRGMPMLFGAGPWFGCISGDDTVVVVGYNPNTGGSEFFPALSRYRAAGEHDPADRIYDWRADWPPPRDRFPMAPAEPLSQADLWCCYSDSFRTEPAAPKPALGFDIVQTVYAWDYPLQEDVLFLRYQLANVDTTPLEGCLLGLCFDYDIGERADDMAGVLLERALELEGETVLVHNVGFGYDRDNVEYWPRGDTWAWTPGAVAAKLLYPDGRGALRSFKRFSIVIRPDQDRERYLMMSGYDYRIRLWQPYDSIDPGPADKRVVMTAEVFRLRPGEKRELWFALIGSPYGDRGQPPEERDLTDLLLRCYWAQETFNEHLLAYVEEGVEEPEPYDGVVLFPNPMRGPASVRFTLRRTENVRLDVVDRLGRNVRTLEPGWLAAGNHAVSWDGTDRSGRTIGPGVYFVRVSAGPDSAVRKLVKAE